MVSVSVAELVRDDISKMPIPAVGKRYARLHGMAGLRAKQKMWYKLGNELANKDRRPGEGFKSKDAVGKVQHSFKESDDLFDWIQEWCQDRGSAVEIWGKPQLWIRIKKLVESGATVFSVPDEEDRDNLMELGCKLVAEEYNGDSFEAILVRQRPSRMAEAIVDRLLGR